MKNTIRYLSLLVVLCCSIASGGHVPEEEAARSQLKLAVSPVDAGSVSGGGQYVTGASAYLRASAATGFVFLNWTAADGTVVSTSATFTYTKAEGDEVLTANFKYDPSTPGDPVTPVFPEKEVKDKYTLTLQTDDGGSSLKGAGDYAPGTEVNISVSTATNYTFAGWVAPDGTLLSQTAAYTYTMPDDDVTLRATFQYTPGAPGDPTTPVFPDKPVPVPTHKVTATVTPVDAGSATVGTADVAEGSTTQLKATAATGFVFTGWYVADTLYSVSATFTYTMLTEDIAFEARFEYQPGTPGDPTTPVFPDKPDPVPTHKVTATVTPVDAGSATVGTADVAEGSTTQLKATAATGFVFTGWYVADTLYNANATFTYTMLTEDIAFEARFEYRPGTPGDPAVPSSGRYSLFLKSSVRALPGRTVQYPVYLTCLDTLTDIHFNMSFPIGITPNLESIAVSEKAVGYTLKCEKLEGESKTRSYIAGRRYAEEDKDEDYGSVYALSLTGGQTAPCGTQLITMKLDVDETFTDSVSQRCGINQISVTNTDGTTETASARHGSMVLREVTEQGTYYYLTVISTGNGTTTVSGKAIRNSLQEVELLEGTSVYAYFAADQGFYLSRVAIDGVDITEQLANGRWLVNNITDDVTLEVDYAAVPHVRPTRFIVGGVAYQVTSDTADVVSVVPDSAVSYQGHLTIPETVTYDETLWTVTALADSAFCGCSELITLCVPTTVDSVGCGVFWDCPRLAAVEWLPGCPLADSLWNDNRCENMLLYVSNRSLAPETVQNVVVGDTGERIVLTDGADFYCPRAFTATRISYTHTYAQQTVPGVCRGWESIVLPFGATSIRHAAQGEIYPFALLTEEEIEAGLRPFWLYEFTADDEWKATGELKAYVPYIISMPNSTAYPAMYCLGGSVTFAAEDAYIETTDIAENVEGAQRWFCPSFAEAEAAEEDFLLNVAAEYEGHTEGSVFVRQLRKVRPFEAYFRLESPHEAKRFFSIFEDKASSIADTHNESAALPGINTEANVIYDMTGRKVGHIQDGASLTPLRGIYIIGGNKYLFPNK